MTVRISDYNVPCRLVSLVGKLSMISDREVPVVKATHILIFEKLPPMQRRLGSMRGTAQILGVEENSYSLSITTLFTTTS